MVDKLSNKQIYDYLKDLNKQVYDFIVEEDISGLESLLGDVEASGITTLSNYDRVVNAYRYSEAPLFIDGMTFPASVNEMLNPFIIKATQGYDIDTITKHQESKFFAFMIGLNKKNVEFDEDSLSPKQKAFLEYKEELANLYTFDEEIVVGNDLIQDDLSYLKILTDKVVELVELRQQFYIGFDFHTKGVPTIDFNKASEKEKLDKLTTIIKSMYVDKDGKEIEPMSFLTIDDKKVYNIILNNYMRGKYLHHLNWKNYHNKQQLPKNILFYIELAFYLSIPGSKEIEKFLNLHGYSFMSDIKMLDSASIFGKYNVRYKDLRRWIDIGLSYNTINKLMGFEIQIGEKRR